MSVQVRRAGQSLDYGDELPVETSDEIIRSLRDPTESIFVAAKHLSDLRDLDFAGISGNHLTDPQLRTIGARYNRGADLSYDDIQMDLDYGDDLVKRWNRMRFLLGLDEH
jgi:hypothetical protein